MKNPARHGGEFRFSQKSSRRYSDENTFPFPFLRASMSSGIPARGYSFKRQNVSPESYTYNIIRIVHLCSCGNLSASTLFLSPSHLPSPNLGFSVCSFLAWVTVQRAFRPWLVSLCVFAPSLAGTNIGTTMAFTGNVRVAQDIIRWFCTGRNCNYRPEPKHIAADRPWGGSAVARNPCQESEQTEKQIGRRVNGKAKKKESKQTSSRNSKWTP